MPSPRDIRRRIKSDQQHRRRSPKRCRWWRRRRCARRNRPRWPTRPFARLLYRIQREATTHAASSTIRCWRCAKSEARGDPGRRGQRVVRGAQQQPVSPGRAVRSGVYGVHHRRTQGAHSSSRALAGNWWRSSPSRDSPRFAEARAIAAFARDLFLKGEVDEVQIVATRFINTLTQQAVVVEFLPVGEIKGLKIPGRRNPKRSWPPTRLSPL